MKPVFYETCDIASYHITRRKLYTCHAVLHKLENVPTFQK